MKGLQKRIIGLAIAAMGLVVAGLINYVVEHGELPPWSSGALSWLSSLMLIQTPWAFWELLAILLTPCVVCGVLIIYLWNSYSDIVDDFNEQNDKLRIAESAKERFEKDHIELKAANAVLLEENKGLKVQNQSMPTKHAASPALTDRHSSILLLISECENASVITTMGNLSARTNLQKVALFSTLDDLKEFGYLTPIQVGYDKKYQLTASGRKFVLSIQQV